MTVRDIARRAYRFFRRPRSDDLTALANYYDSDKGTVHIGAHNYTRVYQSLFEPMRLKPIRFLEIGLLHPSDTHGVPKRAPSLDMWRKFFPMASIVGFDIKDYSKVRIPRCEIVHGDASKVADLTALAARGPFDVIIDDASHQSDHQQLGLAQLFKSLKPGGLYIIEDLHWQPTEPPEMEKTTKVLHRFNSTRKFESSLADDNASSYLTRNIAKVEFFDSEDKVNAYRKDGLAVITKAALKT